VDEPSIGEQRLRQILRELERALADAIGDSPEISEGLRRIRDEGYDVQVVFDCKARTAEPERTPRRRTPQPVFRIHGDDLAFLRSIGIDPTRRKRSG